LLILTEDRIVNSNIYQCFCCLTVELDTVVDINWRKNASSTIYQSVYVVKQWNWTPLLILTEDRVLAAIYMTVFLLLNHGIVHLC
jgi:hypothetical protein